MKTSLSQQVVRRGPGLGLYLRGGFTLIEILIVVVILGILAAVVVPQFTNASAMARENTLKDELRYLRTQITIFRAQHRDIPPGYPSGSIAAGPSEAAFVAQMTQHSNDRCGVSATLSPSYPLGPYLTYMPRNPVNGFSSILIVADGQPMPAPTGQYGWIYSASLQQIMPDLVGTDSEQRRYADY